MKHGGPRPNAGRPPNSIPSQRIVIHATDDELAQVLKLTPRERTVALLIEPEIDTDFAQCEVCGTNDNLIWGPNPYSLEINDDATETWLCQNCWQEFADDV